MNSKERVEVALQRGEPDVVPIYVPYTEEVYQKLEKCLNLCGRELEIYLAKEL